MSECDWSPSPRTRVERLREVRVFGIVVFRSRMESTEYSWAPRERSVPREPARPPELIEEAFGLEVT